MCREGGKSPVFALNGDNTGRGGRSKRRDGVTSWGTRRSPVKVHLRRAAAPSTPATAPAATATSSTLLRSVILRVRTRRGNKHVCPAIRGH